ncbi:MAG: hypothetical protein KC466_10480 [Myxococcales bacterium]|nr:hypothetical protein [Myxococcales bacterium]
MRRSRAWLLRVLALSLGAVVVVSALNFAIDPLQHYRAATFYKTVYKGSRYLNPGLAKTHDYDTALFGTSMVQNTRPSQVDRVLGVRSVKLAMPGATAHELGVLLGTTLRAGRVRRVILALDLFSFPGGVDEDWIGDEGLPLYLYDDDPWNDINYLANWETLAMGMKAVRAVFRQSKGDLRRADPDFYGYWGNKFTYTTERMLKRWEWRLFRDNVRKQDWSLARMRRNFEVNLLPYMRAAPGVRFDLYWPPYSILAWIDIRETGSLATALAFKRAVLEDVSDLPNVRVYDFQPVASITHDLANYKDETHYAPKINDWVIEQIGAEAHVMTPANAEARLRDLEQQARSWTLDRPAAKASDPPRDAP